MHFFSEQSKEDEQAVTHNEVRGMNEKFVDILNGIYNRIERFLNCDAKTFILYARFMIEISMQHEIVF